MKKRINKIWGVGLTLVMLVTLLSFASPAAAVDLEWVRFDIPMTQSYQLAPGTDASFVTVASSGAIFVCDTQGDGRVYKSTDGGFNWTRSNDMTGVVALAISPDFANDNRVFATTATQVYMSTNGGGKFDALGATLTTGNITSLAVAPDYTGGNGEVMIGTTNNVGGSYGNVYMWGHKGLLNWVPPDNKNLAADVVAVAFSPNYPIDSTILAVAATSSNTTLNAKVSDGAWNAATIPNYPVYINDAKDVGDAGTTDIVSAAMAFPRDWNGSLDTTRREYVATVSGLTTDHIYRITKETSKVDLTPAGGGDEQYVSLLYNGDYNTGILYAGSAGTNEVWRCSNPTSSDRVWYSTKNAPSGTGGPTYLALDPNFATNNKVFASAKGAESALSISEDGGVNFYQTGMIDTNIDTVRSFQAASSSAFFLATSNAGSPSSLWKSSNSGANWKRILYYGSSGDNVLIRLSPNYATDQTLYFGAVGGTAIRLSVDGGGSFQNRISPQTIKDMIITDSYGIWVAGTTQLQQSTNGGWTWKGPESVTGIGGINSIAYDVGTKSILVGGQAGEIFISTTGKFPGPALGGASGIGATASQVKVAFGPDYGKNGKIFAGDASGTIDGVWGFDVGKSTSWKQYLGTTLTLGVTDMAAAADGTFYVTNPVAGGGLQRTLDIMNKPDPEWDAVTEKLPSTSTLVTVAVTTGSNILLGIDSASLKIYSFGDTLTTTAPALKSPDDKAASTESGAVTLVWGSVPGSKGYQYQVNDLVDFKGTDAANANVNDAVLSVRVTGLQEGKTYYWRVRVSDKVISPWSAVRSITTQITSVSNAPAIESPSDGGTGPGGYNAPLQPLFQWAGLKWATGYEFMLAKDSLFKDVVVNKTGADKLGNTTVYQTVTKLDYSTTYYWKVRGVGPSSTTDWSPVVGFSTMAKPVEPAPPVQIQQMPAPIINIPAAPPAQQIVIPPAPAAPAPITPAYIWAIIIIGAVLVILLIVFIMRARPGAH